jgi:SAM-dependent methyltransferase
MLHVAPEPCLMARIRPLPHIGYTSADLNDRNAMACVDLMRLPYPDRIFDIIFCSHVLEHVADDRKAISELHRVLTPTGWAIFMVPITAPATFQDTSIADPRMREAIFGQRDHVRRYGPDIEQRLAEGGFRVRRFALEEVVSREEAERMSLPCSDTI